MPSIRHLLARLRRDDGAATVEWTLVAAILTMLFLSVLQLGFGMHVRTTLIDAAAEGARTAGLEGAHPSDGVERTTALIATALSPGYANDVSVVVSGALVTVTVRAPLPLIGLLGLPDGIEVQAHAPVEG
ncbi:TadE/TadG family type IV pilus assembly protein [Gulosibacter macacae]|uniref:TadE/TadG family type IV pilus assembly protein n=1 Tax=Gulosibacter macacae TaxID=2488791 RepID=UPI001F3DF8B5|nr:TadE family protein [Gulosibacter macacae]